MHVILFSPPFQLAAPTLFTIKILTHTHTRSFTHTHTHIHTQIQHTQIAKDYAYRDRVHKKKQKRKIIQMLNVENFRFDYDIRFTIRAIECTLYAL